MAFKLGSLLRVGVRVCVCVTATPAITATTASAPASAGTRRRGRRRRRRGRRRAAGATAAGVADSERTRSRSSAGGAISPSVSSSSSAPMRRSRPSAPASPRSSASSRSGAIGSDVLMGFHLCCQARECAGESRRARRGRDLEQARGLAGVELEQDAQGDDLAVGGAQAPQAGLERRGVAVAQACRVFRRAQRLAQRGEPLARPAPPLGAQVVERAGAGDRQQPAARAGAPRVEADRAASRPARTRRP